jgi:glycerol-3-phosphate cytidylyltransferase
MKRVLYTGGTFDIFHYGHMNFLKQCKSIADEVVVSLNTDEFIWNYKQKKPILSYFEREQSLLGCRYVDRVVKNVGDADSKPAILSVKPSIIAIGDDWAKKDYYSQMQFTPEWLAENGIVLVYVPYTRGISSTELRERIRLDGLQIE